MKSSIFALFFLISLNIFSQGKEFLGVGAGMTFPSGEFIDYAKSGNLVFLHFEYKLSEKLSFGGEFSYIKFGEKEVLFATDTSSILTKFNISQVPIIVEGKYFFYDNLNVILNLGAALVTNSQILEITTNESQTEEDYSSSKFKFIGAIGLGYDLKLNENLFFSLQGKFNYVDKFNFFSSKIGINILME